MPTDPIQAEMSEALDQFLLSAIKEGVTTLDGMGNVVKVAPSAAMIKEARTRLKDLGVTQVVKQGSGAAKLAQEMKARGLKFNDPPPVSTADEEAA